MLDTGTAAAANIGTRGDVLARLALTWARAVNGAATRVKCVSRYNLGSFGERARPSGLGRGTRRKLWAGAVGLKGWG